MLAICLGETNSTFSVLRRDSLRKEKRFGSRFLYPKNFSISYP